ncbi:MAG: adenylyltransferase/cytidyltransferase family protein [Oligosphaeraceae bacterium]|nr:adenylyltransferase/cytidyltransferase family protein [Oligosphaeraceae bacterium]
MLNPQEKIISFENLAAWRETRGSEVGKLVLTNGVFDLLHSGHLQYLYEASLLGDLLVCINDDAGTTQLKGSTRPVHKAEDRAFMLASLQAVSAVCVFPGHNASEAIALARPDIYVKGGDYCEGSLDRKEYAVLKKINATIKFIPFVESYSTTALIERIKALPDAKTPADWPKQLDPALAMLYTRRSIRKFCDKAVSQDTLRELIKAGMAAPSARARNPWEFVIVQDQARKHELAEILPAGAFLVDAAATIIVCGDIDKANDQSESFMLQDCSLAAQNIMLAINAFRLGSCCLGIHPRQERVTALQNMFKLPKNIIPIMGITLGWPAEQKEPRSNFSEKALHWY